MYNYACTCRSSFGLQSPLKHNQNLNNQAAKERRMRYQEEEELYMEMEVSCIPNYCHYRGISHSAVYKCSCDGREKHLIPISRLDLKPVLKRGEFCQKELCCFFSSCHYFLNTSRDIVSNNKLIPAKIF